MRNCLWCRDTIDRVSWGMFSIFEEEWKICEECKSKLAPISGEICLMCGRPLAKLNHDYIHEKKCLDCQKWKRKDQSNTFVHNRSFYEYNDFIKHILVRYKYRGDAEAGRAFNSVFVKKIRKSYKFIDGVIPIPLSNERLYERGFNQCEIWIEKESQTLKHCLVRTQHEEKQSKKSRAERINRSEQMFQVTNHSLISGKKLLVIDDLYTTGTTIHHAAHSLVSNGAKEVYSLTLCRG
ncbi:ComF family protein [Guptibacillus algicola]|uniref:ComF family protein n=1 Tax=Guptibacillus algicola TaxID=225844 RepID=UPI001CD3EC9D|nr:ComF family protein [Alkalihalobacillus algicola]MCA0986847.1 ComF family protein [Alkalihalobacillus algicola]